MHLDPLRAARPGPEKAATGCRDLKLCSTRFARARHSKSGRADRHQKENQLDEDTPVCEIDASVSNRVRPRKMGAARKWRVYRQCLGASALIGWALANGGCRNTR
jgi:hypothetical protein